MLQLHSISSARWWHYHNFSINAICHAAFGSRNEIGLKIDEAKIKILAPARANRSFQSGMI